MNNSKIKKFFLLILILLLLVIGGCTVLNYYNQDSSVNDPVDELQELIDAKNAGEEIDEDRIEELVIQITEEAEAEIETLIDENETDPETIQEISDQIDQIQTDLLETLEEALDVVGDEEIANTIEETIDTVTENKEEAQGEPDQPETIAGEATQEEQPEDAPGEPVQTEQPEIEPGDGIPTQNTTNSSQEKNK